MSTRRKMRSQKGRRNRIPRSIASPSLAGRPLVTYNRSQSPFCPRVNTVLTFNQQSVLTFITQTRANFRYTVTNLYDMDPLVGSTSIPGFAEYAAMYRYYQAKSYRISVNFANNETFNVVAYMCPVNSDPGSNYASYINYMGNNRSKKTILGPITGMGFKKLSQRFQIRDIGEAQLNAASTAYVGRTDGSAAPPNEVYHTVGIVSQTALTSAGVLCDITISVEVEFWEPTSPAS